MARIRLNPVRVHQAARNKGWSEVKPLTREVLGGARYLAPRGSHHHGSGKPVAATRLADTGRITYFQGVRSVYGFVRFGADWASTVAVGSRPHRIPKHGDKLMGFHWPRAQFSPRLRRRTWRGKSFFTKVRHPGNKRPVRYLQTPLAQYGRKRGFKVVTVRNSRSRLP